MPWDPVNWRVRVRTEFEFSSYYSLVARTGQGNGANLLRPVVHSTSRVVRVLIAYHLLPVTAPDLRILPGA